MDEGGRHSFLLSFPLLILLEIFSHHFFMSCSRSGWEMADCRVIMLIIV
jgi:hypothetical protein